MAVVGDFAYFAGEPNLALVHARPDRWLVVVPQNEAWEELIERHKGLRSAVAAKLILECLDEGLYTAWDAANRMSIRLAEKLGYECSREYVVYGVE